MSTSIILTSSNGPLLLPYAGDALECGISRRTKTADIVELTPSLINARLLFSEYSTYSVEHTPEKQTTEMCTLDGMILGHEARWRQRQETSSIGCSTKKKGGFSGLVTKLVRRSSNLVCCASSNFPRLWNQAQTRSLEHRFGYPNARIGHGR